MELIFSGNFIMLEIQLLHFSWAKLWNSVEIRGIRSIGGLEATESIFSKPNGLFHFV